MQTGKLFSTTGKRNEYLHKNLDKNIRRSYVSAGILQRDKDGRSSIEAETSSSQESGDEGGHKKMRVVYVQMPSKNSNLIGGKNSATN